MARKVSLLLLPVDRPKLSQLIFFVIGCLTTTTFAPFGWYPLLPLLLLPFLYVCVTLAPRDAAKHGFWFGFGLFLSGTYWIYISVVIYGNAPSWLALFLMLGLVLVMSIYLWLTAWLISRLASGEPWLLLAVAPAAWVLVEWLRGWVLTGFPWMALGYTQIDSLLAGWAPVLGGYGVSAMMVLSTTAVLVAILTRHQQRWLAIAIVALPWIVGGVLKSVEWTEPAGNLIATTLIQGGVSQDKKWLPEQREPTMNFYRDATLTAAHSSIVVWPEVAIPSVTDRAENYIASLDAISRHTRQTILFGILERETLRTGDVQVYNSMLVVGGQRRIAVDLVENRRQSRDKGGRVGGGPACAPRRGAVEHDMDGKTLCRLPAIERIGLMRHQECQVARRVVDLEPHRRRKTAIDRGQRRVLDIDEAEGLAPMAQFEHPGCGRRFGRLPV